MLNTLTLRFAFCPVKTMGPRAKNEVGFLKLIKPALGPLIKMSDEEKTKINKLIDQKMQQLEDTGLSREQILLENSRKGIPLASDPFFQYLKKNYLARQIYIKAGQRFTVEKVLQIALQQNIGVDPSYSNIIKKSADKTTVVRMEDLDKQRKTQPTEFSVNNYNANANFTPEGLKQELKQGQTIKYIYKPLEKYDKIRVKTRVLRHYDIHWRNVQLITQFLTRAGNIKSRFNSCLPYYQHKKMQKAIKAARSMFLIPCFGQVQINMNRNLTTLEDQVNRIGKRQINLQTGHVYFRKNTGIQSNEQRQFKRSDADTRWKGMKEDGPHYKLWLDSLKQDMKNEDFDRLTKAESYARHLKKKELLSKGIDVSKDTANVFATEVQKRIGIRRNKSKQLRPQEEEQAKKAYEQQEGIMMNSNIYNFAELLIKEKTL